MSALQKHCVVALDAWVKLPDFNFEHETIIIPNGTTDPDPDILAKATIFTTSGTPVTENILASAPNLQLVACNGTGTDHVVKESLRQRGIALCHVPAQNTDSVSEHAFALYYALRRKIIPSHNFVMEGKLWPEKRAPYVDFGAATRTNGEETLYVSDMHTLRRGLTVCSSCVVGYGALGKKIESIGKALGMQVIIAERKGATTARPGRTLFEQALRDGTFFVVVAPLDDTTRHMIAEAELSLMDPTAFVVNVGRGGIVDEAALAQALRDNTIAGAGIDVFEVEPCGKGDSPLLDPTIPNLILSPHLAWYSTRTIKGTLAMIKANLEAFAAGKPQNLVTL